MLEAIRFDTIQGHTEGSLVSRQRIGESKDDINKLIDNIKHIIGDK